MSKREGELKSAFAKELERHCPSFYILFYATAGAPDRSIVGAGRQTNWEMKHGTPAFESLGNQELLCMRIAVASHCRYIIWQENANGFGQRTLIVHPRVVYERQSWHLTPEAWCVGYDHHWLVNYIRSVHESHC